MKRKYLTIKERGFILKIPGLTEVKTPVTIDITRVEESLIKTHLNKLGITNYEIHFKSNEITKKIKIIKDLKEENIKELIHSKMDINMNDLLSLLVEKSLKDDESINLKINNLADKMLDEFESIRGLIKTSNRSILYSDIDEIEDDEEEEETETFIPQIDNSDMKVSSDLSMSTFKSDDFSDALNKLKKLKQ